MTWLAFMVGAAWSEFKGVVREIHGRFCPIRHPNDDRNHAPDCRYRRTPGTADWRLCDCGVFRRWAKAGEPSMAECE